MKYTLGELSKKLELELQGNENLEVSLICGLTDDQPDGISFVSSEKALKAAAESKIPAFIVKPGFFLENKDLLISDNPDLAMIKLAELFSVPSFSFHQDIHPSAVLGKNVELGKDVTIGPNCVLGDNVVIRENTKLFPGVVLLDNVEIGKDCIIYSNVTLYDGVTLSDRVIIHAGTVIGSDGYGFYQHEGKHVKIPQVGTVTVENDVEIGANCTIDRGRFTETRIGEGTKLDNLVHFAHNVKTGKHCLITGQCGIAGSTQIGDYVVMAGQSGIVGHLKVGNHVTVLGKAVISKNTPDPGVWAGNPARPADVWRKAMVQLYKLGKKPRK